MDEILQELVEIVKTLNQRDFWDYAAIIAPLILSVVAIVISIYSIHEQNKIALFDKRYKANDILVFLMSAVSKIVDGSVNEIKREYLDTVIETYKTISTVGGETFSTKKYSDVYVGLIFEAGKSVNIFKLNKDENEKITKFLIKFQEYVSNAYANKVTNDVELKKAYNQLVELHIEKKMEKQMKIK